MTAALAPRERLRRPAGTPEGGQFAPAPCRNAYAALDELAARAAAAEAGEQELPAGWRLDPANPYRVLLPDPGRCPHGSFPRYAARNCCRAAGDQPTQLGPAIEGAAQCTGSKVNGDRCTRRTTRRFRDRPACPDHGGRAA